VGFYPRKPFMVLDDECIFSRPLSLWVMYTKRTFEKSDFVHEKRLFYESLYLAIYGRLFDFI
jgi:hypothetical protein